MLWFGAILSTSRVSMPDPGVHLQKSVRQSWPANGPLHRLPIQELCRAFPHPGATAIQEVFLLLGHLQSVEAVSEILPDDLHDLELSLNWQCFDVFCCHLSIIPRFWPAGHLLFCTEALISRKEFLPTYPFDHR